MGVSEGRQEGRETGREGGRRERELTHIHPPQELDSSNSR